MTYEYLKTETDRLLDEKLPVRVIYRDGDTIHVAWAQMPTGDHERYVSQEIFPGQPVVFEMELPR